MNLSPAERESRPAGNRAAIAKNTGGRSGDQSIGIANLAPRDWDAFMAGYACGYDHGREAGYRASEADIAAVWAPVAAMVHRAASQPPKSPETVAAERRRAEASRAYWAGRRGEGAA